MRGRPVVVTVGGEPGEDLLEILQRNDVEIPTACGGIASCGLCRVRVLAGASRLSLSRSKERERVDEAELADGVRLACQAKIEGNAEAELEVHVLDDAPCQAQPEGFEEPT